jgi:calcyclin binding protein
MSELEEVRYLLTQATYPGVIETLKTHEKTLVEAEKKLNENKNQKEEETRKEKEVEVSELSTTTTPSPSSEKGENVRVPAPVASLTGDKVVYVPITSFAWDQNGYDSPVVTVYVDLERVGTVKDQVKCDFTSSSFDLRVMSLDGKNYRLVKDNLDKDILPEKSKILVKKNKIVVKLHKVKGQYSYESWTNLTSKKTSDKRNKANKDPSAGIMDMMKDMYDEGDDNMRKIIGEAMLKSKSGEKMDTSSMPSMDGL